MSTSRKNAARAAPVAVTSEDVRYHESSGAYRTVFDPGSQLVSEAVLATVAEAASAELLDLPPLYGAVDPDALNALLSARDRSRPTEGVAVSFAYAGFAVEIDGAGTVVVSSNAALDPSPER
jgi:hypothetical protein